MADTVKSSKKKKRKRSPALIAGIILLIFTTILMITLAMFASFDEVTNRFEAGKVDIVLTETKWKPEEAKNVVPEQVLDKNPRITNKEEMVPTYVFLEVVVPYIDVNETIGENDNTTMQLEQSTIVNDNNNKGKLVGFTSTTSVPLYKFGIQDQSNNNQYNYNETYQEGEGVHPYDQNVKPGWVLVSTPTKNATNKTYTYIYAHVKTVENNGVWENDSSGEMSPLGAGYSTQFPLFDKIRVVNFNEKNLGENDPNRNRDYSIKIHAYGIQANYLDANNQTKTTPADVWAVLNPGSGS